ncbi:MAG TPA: SDR family NAD(P)-dependent oxidoreductase [Xanthobacteraceae bacterium]|nr:SDR family NAD(P)-dependent oxidoreductase [Xanthobacteraceae bacterium]
MAALAGRHALVTGGSRGIGRAIAAALAEAGATVTVVGRNAATLKDAVAHGHATDFIAADVTDAPALDAGIADAAARHGPVDILIANAGGAESAPFAKGDPELFRRMFDLNVMGSVHAIRAVLGGMVSRGFGRIVAVASTAGLKGYAYVSAYCAAKHAVIGLVRALALETAKSGVTVNAVCPGYTETDMVRESAERIAAKTGRPAEEAVAAMVRNNPLGRLIRPDEVAAAVLYLCSAEASAVTGATLTVAGGEV